MNETEVIAFALFFALDGDGIEDVENQWRRWQDTYKPALSQDHSGDCRQEPWTCLRCLADRIYSEAQAIAALWRARRFQVIIPNTPHAASG